MNNEAAKIPCTEPFADNGTCIVQPNMFGDMKLYPGNYGEGCGIHAEPADPDCSNPDGTPKAFADQAEWCKLPWSYVNPCTCDVPDIQEVLPSFGQRQFYSYGVCGAKVIWNNGTLAAMAPAAQAARRLKAQCPPSPPPPAVLMSPFQWPRSQNRSGHCQCLPLNATPVLCYGNVSQSGFCINYTSKAGFTGFYPPNYGSMCGVHAEPLDPACTDLRTGKPWEAPCKDNITFGCRQSRCDQPWCFVDPCCPHVDGGVQIAGTKLFLAYSYKNCGGNDTSRAPNTLPNRTGLTCKPPSSAKGQSFMTAIAVAIMALVFA